MTSSKSDQVSSLDPSTLDANTKPIPILDALPEPREFYETFVQPRQPVVLQSCWNALQETETSREMPSVEILRKIVGKDSIVEVNRRKASGSFSPYDSRVERLTFHEFIDRQSTEHYMTTQTLPLNEEGRPALYTTPMTELIENGPVKLRPRVLGNLLPVTYNVWMGRTKEGASKGSSSGLHHDYHDNMYCVWHGTKTVQLAPPTASLIGLTDGTLCKQYANGRIVYEEQQSQGMIRADGALEAVETILQLEKERDELVQKLEAEPANNQLEEELERVEEALLDLEHDQNNDEEDTYDEEEAGEKYDNLFGSASKLQNSDGQSVGDEYEESEPNTKKQKTCEEEPESNLNFVTRPVPSNVVFQTVQLSRGDLLYIPAGWFHNVESNGDPKCSDIHLAMNYWVHPPDTSGTFEKPYVSEFWERDWNERAMTE